MATEDTKRPTNRTDEQDRAGTVDRPRGSGVALADEGDVAFGAMAGIAVISAVLVSMLALAGFFGYQADDSASHSSEAAVAAEPAAEAEEAVVEDEAEEQAPETTTTTEAETTTTTEAATTTTEAAPEGAAAVVTAAQGSITLNGTVPDQATADALVAAAIASGYTETEITDNLEIADGATPYLLTVEGSLSNQTLASTLASNLGASAEGVGGEFDDQIEVVASSDLEADLNALVAESPILFESGSDIITADTIATVDAAAELLKASDGQLVEVGGHTDSRGGDPSNLALSERRAAKVVEELVARGVLADQLAPKGYGETQLVENPDDTAEQQQANRRIEFRVIG